MDNGLIIFINENDEKYGFPNPYPNGFSNDTRLPLVAPFWADADISDEEGEVFYQVSLVWNCSNYGSCIVVLVLVAVLVMVLV